MAADPLSVLDRLLGIDPGFDPAHTRQQRVLSDIRDLLESRRPKRPIPPELAEANASLLRYGLPDFAAMTVTNELDHKRVREAIEEAIKLFEPRLDKKTVRVSLVAAKDNSPFLDYRIEAVLLHEDGAREAIAFDTRLDRVRGQFAAVPPGGAA